MTQVTSEVLSVSSLLVKGRFTVPWHQRYYDWTTVQVGELLVDLCEALDEGRSSYFLGSIMLVGAAEDDRWEINDGQQRLITLSLLLAALCRRFAQRRSDAARERIALRMLFDQPETSQATLGDSEAEIPRIQPPKHDQSRFNQLIRGHNIGTNGKLTSAWNEIEIFVTGMRLPAARRLFNFLVEHVELGILYVPQSEDANAVFEALNGRGKRLDDVDLIRNHLYSYFTEADDATRRSTVHDRIESVIVSLRSAQRSQAYFRCFFQCQFGYIQQNRFYYETRAMIRKGSTPKRSRNYVYGLVGSLADVRFVELFRTITATNPNPRIITEFTRESGTVRSRRNLAVFLGELAPYKVAHPLIFALLRRFLERECGTRKAVGKASHGSLRDLTSFIMRVALSEGKFEPSRFEAAFANCANRISLAKDPKTLDIRRDLQDADEFNVMDNGRFVERLANARITDSRKARRLLFAINGHLDRQSKALAFEGCELEHVLPKSEVHWGGWPAFDAAASDASDWVHRIGNLTLLGQGDGYGRGGFNAGFDAKREVFVDSPFTITRKVSEADDWTPETIHQRSLELAGMAAKVWAFPPLRGSRR